MSRFFIKYNLQCKMGLGGLGVSYSNPLKAQFDAIHLIYVPNFVLSIT